MLQSDIRVPEELTRAFCRDAAYFQTPHRDAWIPRSFHTPKNTTSWRLRGEVIAGIRTCSLHPSCDDTWSMDSRWRESTKSSSTHRSPASVHSARRREGDVQKDNSIIADTNKLMGNSSYGQSITNTMRRRDVTYCSEKKASTMISHRRFRQLDIVTGDADEIEMSKRSVTVCSTPNYICYNYIRSSSTRTWNIRCLSTAKPTLSAPTWHMLKSRRWPRDPGTTRTLLPTHVRMATLGVLRRSPGRVRALSPRRMSVER